MSVTEGVHQDYMMGRVAQQKGTKGSLKWIQQIVNNFSGALNKPINDFLGSENNRPIEWLSPKADDDYSEYRDQAFLDLLRIKLSKTKLKDFWPSRGPQWDALRRIEDKTYFLVEAKAHVSEIQGHDFVLSQGLTQLTRNTGVSQPKI